ALAHAMKSRFDNIDDWQMRVLTQSCRAAKEALLSDSQLAEHPLVVPSRSSHLIKGTLKAKMTRDEISASLLEGFFPALDLDSRPQAPHRVGLTMLGLPYAADPAITR